MTALMIGLLVICIIILAAVGIDDGSDYR